MYAKEVPCYSLVILLALCSVALSMVERPADTPPPTLILGSAPFNTPMVLSSNGDTAWIQVHTDSTFCPGDPTWGHGGEATGGPGPLETWCFEGGPGDSCGTNPPWDTNCFYHVDVRKHPSPMNVNYWHIDSYRADQRPYCGDYCVWCGSDSLWTDGYPVECGTWAPGRYPGYGDQWNCVVQLTLPETFDVANGCTLFFDPRYDTECKYDYFYVDFYNGTKWKTLATFNASSNNPGDRCGDPDTPNPDYWGNTDAGQPDSADWQERVNPGEPAFYRVITPDTLVVTTGPQLRWRFASDGAWSDADGRGDTDGAAFIDNVWVWGDSERYTEDFESGVLDTTCWSTPDLDGVVDHWHISHDPDPPEEAPPTTCVVDSSFVYRGRPEGGYKVGTAWRNGWFYRLMTPRVPIQNSGCVVQYDQFICALDYTCDYPDTKVRFYNGDHGKWCPWIDMDLWVPGGCYFWYLDREEDVSSYYSSGADSMQFCWELVDVSYPGDFCRGKHTGTDHIVDNVSIGFYDANATVLRARTIDLLQDTFFDNLCGYNSFFNAYNSDTVNHYSGPPYDDVPLPRTKQLYVEVSDRDELGAVELFGSIDEGDSWETVTMTMAQPFYPSNPALGGDYYGTLCPSDFELATWDTGTVVWYYVKATDSLSNVGYYPSIADPSHPDHTGDVRSYFEFSVLPMFPPEYTGPKILLVDGYGRRNYDYAQCVGALDNTKRLEDIYEETLTDAGYCYDKYDITGGGSNIHIHPIWYDDYDCVIWFNGPYFSNYLYDAKAQRALRDYLADSGNVILLGDRLAYNMSPDGVGEDSLNGEFLAGIMGCDYIVEQEGAFDKPYLYGAAVETVYVFGQPVEVALDTIAIYKECPYLKDMSYVAVIDSPPVGYLAQSLVYLTNPTVGAADEVIYTEYQGAGQCVFVNFDLCGTVNHERGYCSGDAHEPAPDFVPGTYDGRVELIRVILEDIFDLPSGGGGPADIVNPPVSYNWALHQNTPNPCLAGTEIRYEVARSARVSLKVYNALGQVVRVLEQGTKDPGSHQVRWDGRNELGEPVSSGVYFYKLTAGDFTATRKMLVLR